MKLTKINNLIFFASLYALQIYNALQWLQDEKILLIPLMFLFLLTTTYHHVCNKIADKIKRITF